MSESKLLRLAVKRNSSDKSRIQGSIPGKILAD